MFQPRSTTKDLTSQRFGLLVAEHIVDRPGRAAWQCHCDCGGEKVALSNNLLNGTTKSCGCLHRQRASEANRTHGESRETPEYRAWKAMLTRCGNVKQSNFENYGGRDIGVCKRWTKFENFLADMGRRPSPDYTLERKNVNGHYVPSNCIWATRTEQARNTRRNRRVTIEGRTKTISEWEASSLLEKAVINRLKHGWTTKDAFSVPRYHRRTR